MTTVYLFDSPFDDSGKHLLIPTEKNAEGFLKELLSVLPYKRYDNVTWKDKDKLSAVQSVPMN